MFDIGDKVVCVNDTRPADKNPTVVPNWPTKDEKYTIRGFHNNDDIVVGVLLEEIQNFPVPIPLVKRWQEPAFATWRFEKTESATMEAVTNTEEVLINN